jgi:hypothetical protein
VLNIVEVSVPVLIIVETSVSVLILVAVSVSVLVIRGSGGGIIGGCCIDCAD